MDEQKSWNEANLGPTNAKRQHYVPRAFLSGFAVDGKIGVFDLDKGTEYTTSVENAAVEAGFYDEEIGSSSLSSEGWLAQLEGKATPVINKLLNNLDDVECLSREEEFYMARFLAALRLRTPAFQAFSNEMFAGVLQQIKEMAKRQVYHGRGKDEADAIWEEMRSKPDHWWVNEAEPQQAAAITNSMLSEVQGYANLVWAAPWRIGAAPESASLYTSDNPVAGCLRAVRPWWERAAFASLTYFVPLSRRVLLKIDRRPDRSNDEAKEIRGERRRRDFSQWEISFARHVVTNDASRYLYGEGPIVPRDCAAGCLDSVGRAQLEFAIQYLGFDPRPPG